MMLIYLVATCVAKGELWTKPPGQNSLGQNPLGQKLLGQNPLRINFILNTSFVLL